MSRRRFNPSLWSTLAAAAGIAATIGLGQWQLGRAQQKAELLAAREAALREAPIHLGQAPLPVDSIEDRRVEARGRFDPRGMVFLDNRVRNGRPGYEVVMPLRIEGGDMHVLVNRGWVAADADRTRLPRIRTPEHEVSVTGIAVVPGRKVFELSDETIQGRVWQNLSLERYRARMDYKLHPVMIQQTSEADDGLLREWPTPRRSIDVHRSYALQWFSFAALIAALYVYFGLRRDSPSR